MFVTADMLGLEEVEVILARAAEEIRRRKFRTKIQKLG